MKIKAGKILKIVTIASAIYCAILFFTVLITYLVRANTTSSTESVYTQDLMKTFFFILALPFLIYLALIIYSGITFSKEPIVEKVTGVKRLKDHGKNNPKLILALRVVVGVVAIAFILIGVLNKGSYSVWVKAVNICRECVGIG